MGGQHFNRPWQLASKSALLLALGVAVARCGETEERGSKPGVSGEGGNDASSDGAGVSGQDGGATEAGRGQGGLSSAGDGSVGGAGAAGAGGAPPVLTCAADDVRLRMVGYGEHDERWFALTHDALGRLVQVSGAFDVAFDHARYSYGYDDQNRIHSISHSYRDGQGYTIQYESGVVRYVDDDLKAEGVEVDGARWLRELYYSLGGGVARTETVTWDEGLITQVSTAIAGYADTVATYHYDVDGHGRPIRMVTDGEPAPLTEEVYDAAGHHLLQLERDAEGGLSGVRLYRDNVDPVRSLLERVYPWSIRADNLWLWASFDAEGDTGLVGSRLATPLSLVPWSPLSLAESEAVDFALDLNGDDKTDAAGDYTFDDQGRLSSFVLELSGEPRVSVQMTYTPTLVTESVEYPGSKLPPEVRRYHYGCDDVEPPSQL